MELYHLERRAHTAIKPVSQRNLKASPAPRAKQPINHLVRMSSRNSGPFISTLRTTQCLIMHPSLGILLCLICRHHLSSTNSIIGGTAYGQNITTATTGKYLQHNHISLSSLSPLFFSFPPMVPLAATLPPLHFNRRKELTS
jgi:hypothetical protein